MGDLGGNVGRAISDLKPADKNSELIKFCDMINQETEQVTQDAQRVETLADVFFGCEPSCEKESACDQAEQTGEYGAVSDAIRELSHATDRLRRATSRLLDNV